MFFNLVIPDLLIGLSKLLMTLNNHIIILGFGSDFVTNFQLSDSHFYYCHTLFAHF